MTIRQEALEHSLLDALQNHLMDKELLKVFCDEYTRHSNTIRKEQHSKIRRYQNELENLAKEKDRIIDAIKNGIPASEVKDGLDQIIARRKELETLLNATQEAPVLLHPNMAHRYHIRG